ncbi:MAG: hypothetical protein MN733_10390, partial [Nitrososphaera sp.]|nr:hypothetical protein [Nitrososphaera sp.]
EQVIQTKSPEFKELRLVGSDYRECGNSFIRCGDAASPEEQDEIRKRAVEAGAIGVEFPVTKEEGEAKPLQARAGSSLQTLIEAFEKEQDPRRQKVGVMIREGKYEVPTLAS